MSVQSAMILVSAPVLVLGYFAWVIVNVMAAQNVRDRELFGEEPDAW